MLKVSKIDMENVLSRDNTITNTEVKSRLTMCLVFIISSVFAISFLDKIRNGEQTFIYHNLYAHRE